MISIRAKAYRGGAEGGARVADRSVTDTLKGSTIHNDWIVNYRNDEAERSAEELVERTLELAGLPKGAKVLDAGCGTGTNSRRLARAGLKVTGVDFSEYALGIAERGSAGRSIEYRPGDLTRLDLPTASFDGVFCVGVLMHVPELDAALSELVRVLKPGGKLVLAETNASSPEMLAFRLYWKRNGKVRVVRAPSGIETWSETPEGPLLARKMFMPWLIRALAKRGMVLEHRKSSDLTELPIYFGSPIVKKALYRLNRFWLAIRGPASLAVGNILILRKS